MSLDIVHDAVRRGRRVVLEAGHITGDAAVAVAVVGINGSGKSSLFMHLTDALFTSRGGATVTFRGRPATIAYVPQESALPSWLRVADAARVYGLAFDALIERMPGLHLDEMRASRAGALSLGQRQALSIAFALGRNADVTLLDEPFSALDFRRRIGALELLREHRAAGRSLLLSSQSASDLVDVCDRFVVIREGRYVFNGSTAELTDGAGTPHIERRLLALLT